MSRRRTTSAPGARADAAGDGVDQRRLAGAVRPDDAEQLAGADRERHAPQRGRRAVRDLEVAHLKHAAAPRGTRSSTAGSLHHLGGAPSASSTPWLKHDDAVGQRHHRAHHVLDEARSSRPGRGCARISATALVDLARRRGRTAPRRAAPAAAATASARASSRNLRWCRLSSSGSASALAARPVNSSQRCASRSAAARDRASRRRTSPQRHVVEHGQVRERPRDLVGAGDAGARDAVRRQCRRGRGPRSAIRPASAR